MRDENRTKSQLIAELARLRRQCAIRETREQESGGLSRQALRRQVRRRLREAVARMEQAHDVVGVLEALKASLHTLDISIQDCAINLIDRPAEGDSAHVSMGVLAWEGDWVFSESSGRGDDLVLKIWRRGEPVYRRDLEREDTYEERQGLMDQLGHAVRSVVDVPFAYGTLSINSDRPNAFSARDIDDLEQLAIVVEEGFRRRADLERAEQSVRELESVITERRKSEGALRESEEKYRTLVEGTGQPVFTVHRDGLFLFMNRAAASEMGGEPEDFVGKRMHDLFPSEIADLQLSLVARAIHSRQSQTSTSESIIRGARRWYDARIHPFASKGGDIDAALVVTTEITERKHAEDRLKQEYRLRDADSAIRAAVASIDHPQDLRDVIAEVSAQLSALEVAHDGCCLNVMNAEGTDFLVLELGEDWDSDDACWRRLRFSAGDQTLSLELDDSVTRTPEQVQDVSAVVAAWRSGSSRYDPCAGTGLGIRSGGALLDVAFSHGTLQIYSRRADAFGERDIAMVQRFAAIISEAFQRVLQVMEREHLEHERIRTQRLRAVGELSAGISHNLNNILVGILMPAQLLQLTTDDPDHLEEIEAIIAAGERAKELVHRLHLSVRNIEEDQLHPVPVNEVVREAMQTARPRWKDEPEARGVEIVIAADLADVPPIRGTRSRLHDILTNLIFNAVDALPHGGTIRISTRAGEGDVRLAFSDTGVGMDELTRRRVFEPFFTTKMDVGTGLGLSTAHNTMTQWGGDIAVTSAPGEGTTFELRLPVWREDPSESRDVARVSGGRPGRLLLIDDDKGVCQVLSRCLRQDHQVETASSGREVLKDFAAGCFDVVVVDLGMPGMSGDQVLRQMHSLDPALATVLATGWELEEEDPRRDYADFVLQKPFADLAEVGAVIAQAIDLHDERAAPTG